MGPSVSGPCSHCGVRVMSSGISCASKGNTNGAQWQRFGGLNPSDSTAMITYRFSGWTSTMYRPVRSFVLNTPSTFPSASRSERDAPERFLARIGHHTSVEQASPSGSWGTRRLDVLTAQASRAFLLK